MINNLNRHREPLKAARRSSFSNNLDCFVAKLLAMTMCFVFAAALFFPGNAPAQDNQKQDNFTYAPEYCDFAITFPEEPHSAQKCPEEGECYEIKSFTRVFGLRASVNFRVTCNPTSEKMFKEFDGPTMKAALKGMVDDGSVDNFTTHFSAYEDAKIASLTGTSEAGQSQMLYAAQIWLGPKSIFTLEGELIGEPLDEADKLFTDIIASIRSAGKSPSDTAEPKKSEKSEEPEEAPENQP